MKLTTRKPIWQLSDRDLHGDGDDGTRNWMGAGEDGNETCVDHHHQFICPMIQQYAHLHQYS